MSMSVSKWTHEIPIGRANGYAIGLANIIVIVVGVSVSGIGTISIAYSVT